MGPPGVKGACGVAPVRCRRRIVTQITAPATSAPDKRPYDCDDRNEWVELRPWAHSQQGPPTAAPAGPPVVAAPPAPPGPAAMMPAPIAEATSPTTITPDMPGWRTHAYG